MAMRKMSPTGLVYYMALKDIPFKDDDGVTKILTDVQIDVKLKRLRCVFDNGDIQFMGLYDDIEMDPSSISVPVSHGGQSPNIKNPNKKRFKKQKRV